MSRSLLAFTLAVVLASAAVAQTTTIEIVHPFARATAATAKTGAVYLTIVNRGARDDRLIAASSPVAERSGAHVTTDDNGVMRMRPVPSVEIKAGGRVEFQPGGMHVMLIGLKAPLRVGQAFPLTLTFEKAGAVAVTVVVEKPGARRGNDMPATKMPE